MLNNNIKILLVSFVHHIELQNFLNAPRMFLQIFQDHLITTADYSSKVKGASVVSVEAVVTLCHWNLVLIVCRCQKKLDH